MEETMCSKLNVNKGLCKQKSLSSTVDKTQQGFKKYSAKGKMKQKYWKRLIPALYVSLWLLTDYFLDYFDPKPPQRCFFLSL